MIDHGWRKMYLVVDQLDYIQFGLYHPVGSMPTVNRKLVDLPSITSSQSLVDYHEK